MYRREVEGRVLRFGHQGMLYHESFVMYDHQTGSLWVSATGEAFHGPLKGTRLKFIPSTVTTWEAWKKSYPHTLVLPGRRSGPTMGFYLGMESTRNLGLNVVVRLKGKLYPLDRLARQPIVNDRFNGVALLVYYSQLQRTAIAWHREVGGRTLTFSRSARVDPRGVPLLRDKETGSLWRWLSGEAVEGPLRGKKLKAIAHHPIRSERFRAFYKNGPIFSGRETP
ncbi:MAG: DUF3179 domain-containing protein [SAR324 cluster bacterium]|nr:DUF3179 domain-containing protein [SAR324 cluster bacterium]